MGVLDASDSRLAALTQWVVDDLGFAGSSIAPASVDASFRRYFRVTRDADTYIVMDAPPAKEDVGPFVKVARLLAGIDVNVPLILAQDLERGFLLLSDLGSRQYLDELAAAGAADRLYADALASLQRMQTADPGLSRTLPRYDRDIAHDARWNSCRNGSSRRHLGVAVRPQERAMLDRLFESLVHSAAAQPGNLRASGLSLAQSSAVRAKTIPAFWIFKMPFGDRSPTIWRPCSRIATSRGRRRECAPGR